MSKASIQTTLFWEKGHAWHVEEFSDFISLRIGEDYPSPVGVVKVYVNKEDLLGFIRSAKEVLEAIEEMVEGVRNDVS